MLCRSMFSSILGWHWILADNSNSRDDNTAAVILTRGRTLTALAYCLSFSSYFWCMANFEQEFNLISGKFCLLRTVFISLPSNHQPSIKRPQTLCFVRKGLLCVYWIIPMVNFLFFTLYWLNFHLGNQEKAKLWQTKTKLWIKMRKKLISSCFITFCFFLFFFLSSSFLC